MEFSKKNAVIVFALCLLIIQFACMEWPGGTADGVNANEEAGVGSFTPRSKMSYAYFSTLSYLYLCDDFSQAINVEKFENTWAALKKLLESIEQDISVVIETSDIARFNALEYGDGIYVSEHTARIVTIAKEMYGATGGQFDPSVYPLVDLWGFTPRFNVNDYTPSLPYDRERSGSGFPAPGEEYIGALVQLADFGKIELTRDGNGYMLKKMIPPVVVDGREYNAQIDLGGIGKGYAADLVLEMLEELGYEYGYFSIGGSSMALLESLPNADGTNEDMFKLGIRKPRTGLDTGSSFVTIMIKDATVSTSADYDLCYLLDGILYSHIIDKGTGRPVNAGGEPPQKGVASVTVTGSSAVYCDAVSTALFVSDIQESVRFINEHLRECGVVMVIYSNDHDYYEVVTNLPDNEITLEDSAYILAGSPDENGNVIYRGSFLNSIGRS